MTRRARQLVGVFVVGSAVTLVAVYLLARARHPAVAFLVLEASPFPCPTGLPC